MRQLIFAIALFVAAPVPAISNEVRDKKIEILDNELMPLIESFNGPPNASQMEALITAVTKLNAVQATRVVFEKEVVSLNPIWISAKLTDSGADAAMLSLCGKELPSCAEAKARLQDLTAQCSSVFLGIVDLEEYPETSRNLYDTTDPQSIFFARQEGLNGLVPVGLMAAKTPDAVAMALCPKESDAFGHILNMPWPQ